MTSRRGRSNRRSAARGSSGSKRSAAPAPNAPNPKRPERSEVTTRSTGFSGSNRLLLGVGGLVILAAAIIAIVVGSLRPSAPGTGGPASTLATNPGGSASIAPGALPPFESTAGDPAIGRAAPAVTGASFDGSPVAIADDGRPKLLLFLAHWCQHCQREVPIVQDWVDAGRLPAGLDLISIATGIDPSLPNYPPQAWLEREGWEAPVLVDADDTVADRYGLTGFPFWVAIDGEGAVALRVSGELTPEQLDTLAGTVAGTE